MKLKVFNAKSRKLITNLNDIEKQATISQLKELYRKKFPSKYISRQSFRSSIRLVFVVLVFDISLKHIF